MSLSERWAYAKWVFLVWLVWVGCAIYEAWHRFKEAKE